MTTLPTLIQQLRTHRPDSLTELREAIAVVAEAVMANDGETGDEIAIGYLRRELRRVSDERDKAQDERDHYAERWSAASAERDTALADVQRLTKERDAAERAREEFATMWNTAIRERDALGAEVAKLTSMRDVYRDGHEQAAAQRDTALADVQRLTAERDSQRYELNLLLDAARHSLRLAQDDRDRLAAEVKTLQLVVDETCRAVDLMPVATVRKVLGEAVDAYRKTKEPK